MSANQDIADGIVRHRLNLLRLEERVVRDLLDVYDEALGSVQADLESIADAVDGDGDRMPSAERERLEALAGDLDDRVRLVRRELDDRLRTELTAVATAEGPALNAVVNAATPEALVVELGGVPDATVRAMVETPLGGKAWSDRLALDLLGVRDDVSRLLATSLARGASMQNAAASLRAAGKVIETYRGRVDAITRTEIQRVANDVAHESYASNLDVMKGVMRLATLDNRTCLVCGPLHGAVWYYDEDGNLLPNPEHGPHRRCPLHPRCRCFDSPLTKSWQELLGVDIETTQDRERLDGTIPEGMDYPSWFERQPRAEQEAILGPARYELWEAGEVALGDFADAQRVLRLDELAA